MAKKASTINIEQIFWDEIADYMERNDIGNRNTAIEFMLLERRTLLNSTNTNIKTERTKNESVEKRPIIKAEESDDFLGDTIDDVFEGMS